MAEFAIVDLTANAKETDMSENAAVASDFTEEQNDLISEAMDQAMRSAFAAGIVWGREFSDDLDTDDDIEGAYQMFILAEMVKAMRALED